MHFGTYVLIVFAKCLLFNMCEEVDGTDILVFNCLYGNYKVVNGIGIQLHNFRVRFFYSTYISFIIFVIERLLYYVLVDS